MVSVVVGLVIAGMGVWGLAANFDEFILVVKGSFPIMLVAGGSLAILAGILGARDRSRDSGPDRDEKTHDKKP